MTTTMKKKATNYLFRYSRIFHSDQRLNLNYKISLLLSGSFSCLDDFIDWYALLVCLPGLISPSFVGTSLCSKMPNVRDSTPISQYVGSIQGCRKAFHASAINPFRMPCGFQSRRFASLSPAVQRNPSFSRLNSDDIDFFRSILGEKNVVQDEDRLLDANTDWMRKYRGSSKLLLQPRSTEEV